MSLTIRQIKARCPRFRILVIGRRNAGKTTILKKMCDSDGSDLRIVDRSGNEVDPSILEPDRQRGMSDVENEITFGSNPLFVFHDSRGIEAGAEHDENSPLCTDSLWKFIDKRSKETRIRDQIHAIWMCIPMDNPRAPSSEFELAFFNARNSPVPVIAVFTKFEALIDEAYDDLPDDDSSDSEKEKNASHNAQSKFEKTVQKAIENTTHPPNQVADGIPLDLNEVGTGCASLVEATYAMIQDEILSNLFALAQQSSFRVGCEKIMELIIREQQHWIQRVLVDKNKMLDTMIKYTAQLMPYWRTFWYYYDDDDDDDDAAFFWWADAAFYDAFYYYRNTLAVPPATQCTGFTAGIHEFHTGEKSEQRDPPVEATIQLLQNQPDFGKNITKFVQTALSKFPKEADHDKLIHQLVYIVMENVDSLRNM
ncbi:hypothetical protein B0H19DRAFT_1086041 [Mycena capillaripes]|nr:hypothetical protein B0H19DRAFT_1086041 [Mycena capillaripes]